MREKDDTRLNTRKRILTHRTIKLKQILDYLRDPSSLERYSPSDLLGDKITPDDAITYQYLVLDGPTGVGKSHLILYMQNNQIGSYNWRLVRRTTTRPRRDNETDDEIISICDVEFDRSVDGNELLYWEEYEGNRRKYGVSIEDLLKNPKKTVSVLISNIAVARIIPKCAYVYLVPPSLAELRRRVERRGKKDIENIEARISYNIRELQGFMSSYSELVKRFCNVSVLCSDKNQEAECACKVWKIISDGQRILELPKSLLRDLGLR